MKLYGNKRNTTRAQKAKNRSGSGKAREKKRLTGLQKGLVVLALLLVVLVGSVFAIYKNIVRPVDVSKPSMQTEEDVPEEEQFVPPKVVEVTTKVDEETGEETTIEVEVPASHKSDFYNILLLGTDDDGTRTDTIMIGRLDVKNHTVALLSVPRDTLISGNYNVPKINGVYGGAGKGVKGIEALQRKLAQTLGFETDGYVMVNLDAFIELVDLVGGVEVDVPVQMDYEDPSQNLYIHLKPGVQTLNGTEAMGLVRFRKGYATQDIERTHTQQKFLKALAKKCLSIGNISKINEFTKIFMENVTTDLTIGNVAYFAQELLKCDFDNMFAYTLEGEAVMVNGASCYALYQNKNLQVINEHFNPYETAITAANVSVRTPEQVYAEQAAQKAEEEAQQQAEEQAQQEEEYNPTDEGSWPNDGYYPEWPDNSYNPPDTGEWPDSGYDSPSEGEWHGEETFPFEGENTWPDDGIDGGADAYLHSEENPWM